MIRIHSNCTEIKINPACLPMEGIQIYNRQDHIRPILGCFAVTDQRGIVGLVELQIVIALQCPGCAPLSQSLRSSGRVVGKSETRHACFVMRSTFRDRGNTSTEAGLNSNRQFFCSSSSNSVILPEDFKIHVEASTTDRSYRGSILYRCVPSGVLGTTADGSRSDYAEMRGSFGQIYDSSRRRTGLYFHRAKTL